MSEPKRNMLTATMEVEHWLTLHLFLSERTQEMTEEQKYSLAKLLGCLAANY